MTFTVRADWKERKADSFKKHQSTRHSYSTILKAAPLIWESQNEKQRPRQGGAIQPTTFSLQTLRWCLTSGYASVHDSLTAGTPTCSNCTFYWPSRYQAPAGDHSI